MELSPKISLKFEQGLEMLYCLIYQYLKSLFPRIRLGKLFWSYFWITTHLYQTALTIILCDGLKSTWVIKDFIDKVREMKPV